MESRRLLSSWYVSNGGRDTNTGAISSPFQTIGKALAAANPGDQINLRAGTYPGDIVITEPNITLQGYANEKVLIASPINDPSIEVTIDFGTEASGSSLKNLEITGGYVDTIKTETTRQDDTNGTYHGASNLLFDRLKVHDAGTHVIKLSPDSDRVTIRNSEIYNSGRRDPKQGQGVDAVNIDDFLFEKNYIHDTTQNAIFVKGGSQRAIIQDNEIRNAGFGGILIGQDTSPEFFDTKQNPGQFEAIDSVAQRNRVMHTNAAGLAAWSSLRSRIENNYVRDGGLTMQAGFYIATNGAEKPNQDLTFKNNVVGVGTGKVMVLNAEHGVTGNLTMSGNRYFGENHFSNEDAIFQGTLAQWQTLIGGDSGSTFTTGKPPFNSDLNRDADLDIDDYMVMDNAFSVKDWLADLNLDGKVNVDDYVVLDTQLGAPATASAAASVLPFTGPLAIAFNRSLPITSLTDSVGLTSSQEENFLA